VQYLHYIKIGKREQSKYKQYGIKNSKKKIAVFAIVFLEFLL